MNNGHGKRQGRVERAVRAAAVMMAAVAIVSIPGCFSPTYPQADREERILEALDAHASREVPPDILTAEAAVAYALRNNLDVKVAELEIAYQTESQVAARRRLLPSLTMRYSANHSNHPAARWSESTRSGNQSLESSFSADPNSRQAEVGAMWNLLDFGVGYLRARQQGERLLHTELQRRRVRQQVALEVLTHYWRAAAALTVAAEAEALQRELEEQADAIRDSVEMRILSGAEGARRELTVHGGLAELEQLRRGANQAKLELCRVMGLGSSRDFVLPLMDLDTAVEMVDAARDPAALQAAALRRRPELYQHDTQERIAVDEARLALVQMAPNASLSLSFYDDPDKYLEWNNWMTAGARVTWNLLNIPARLSERRMAQIQEKTAKQKGLALAAAVMAQVGIAYSDWGLSYRYASAVARRAATRQRLVEALAAGEADGQTRPGEVLQERVRSLAEKAGALRAAADSRIAAARLANAVGLEVDDAGRYHWDVAVGAPPPVEECGLDAAQAELRHDDRLAAEQIPAAAAGLRLVAAGDFISPDHYFTPGAAATDSAD